MIVVLGIDPGPHTGIAILRYPRPFSEGNFFQVSADEAPAQLSMILAAIRTVPCTLAGGIEEYRRGNIKGKRATGGVTADLVVALTAVAAGHGLRLAVRPAVLVKRWATDARLEAAGLIAPTRGLPHARDAARHSLFAATADAGLPDPLSKRAHINGQ